MNIQLIIDVFLIGIWLVLAFGVGYLTGSNDVLKTWRKELTKPKSNETPTIGEEDSHKWL